MDILDLLYMSKYYCEDKITYYKTMDGLEELIQKHENKLEQINSILCNHTKLDELIEIEL